MTASSHTPQASPLPPSASPCSPPQVESLPSLACHQSAAPMLVQHWARPSARPGQSYPAQLACSAQQARVLLTAPPAAQTDLCCETRVLLRICTNLLQSYKLFSCSASCFRASCLVVCTSKAKWCRKTRWAHCMRHAPDATAAAVALLGALLGPVPMSRSRSRSIVLEPPGVVGATSLGELRAGLAPVLYTFQT